jgi:DNA sulfur modification protein DndB
MDTNVYEFTAIRGVQAGAAYYVVMCALKLVPQLLRFDDAALPADLRAQRVLNRARVPGIARYITSNPQEYILSSLCASVDGEVAFEPVSSDGPLRSVGRLRVSMSATILVNDGQHRRAAIEEAIRDRPYLGDETISIVLFVDRGLVRAQQMFADLNLHAIRPSKSIGVLYDHRDPLASLVRQVIARVPAFRDFTELERTTISNRSLKLFTLSSIYQATAEFLGKSRGARVTDAEQALAITFWNVVAGHMPDWQQVVNRRVSAAELRQDYVHAHGIALQAIAIAGAQTVGLYPDHWAERLTALQQVDWSRANRTLWEGRALVGGRITKSTNHILLVANVILSTLGLPLTPEGERVEALHSSPAVLTHA